MNLWFCETQIAILFFVSASITNNLNKANFQTSLLRWYKEHKRDLPWRKSTDPYVIWISEIILQQTRVNQGLPYFKKFQKNYPSISDLAHAQESQVMKDWEGLGYYSRARNLHSAAKQVVEEFDGDFPKTHAEILKLKGVGDYTAAAISSFAYNLPHAVVDGNVFRVLSRIFGIETAINSTPGKKQFDALADDLLYRKDPATFNQAIMEFGALQCVPKSPDCMSCPFESKCFAKANNRIHELPVKIKKKYDRQRYFNFALISSQDNTIVELRTGSDVWQKLYQFPMVEHSRWLEPEEMLKELRAGEMLDQMPLLGKITDLAPHKLSHQTIHCRLFEFEVDKAQMKDLDGAMIWVKKMNLSDLAFPRPLRKFLDRKQLTLPL